MSGKQSHRVAKAAVAAPGLGCSQFTGWTSVYADAPPNRGGVPSGPTCPMAGVAYPGVPTLPVPGWELPSAARGRWGRAGSSHGARTRCVAGRWRGWRTRGADIASAGLGVALVPLAGGGGVPGVPMEPALAALPADGGGGVPGVPTLPVADCPPLAPACEATPVPLEGGGGVPGVPMEPASLTPAGEPASSLMIVVPLLVPEPPGLPGVSGSYGVALSSTLLGVGKAPRFGVRRLPLSLPVTPALPPLASAPASPALDLA